MFVANFRTIDKNIPSLTPQKMFQIPGEHFFFENRGRRETQILGHFGRNMVDKIV